MDMKGYGNLFDPLQFQLGFFPIIPRQCALENKTYYTLND